MIDAPVSVTGDFRLINWVNITYVHAPFALDAGYCDRCEMHHVPFPDVCSPNLSVIPDEVTVTNWGIPNDLLTVAGEAATTDAAWILSPAAAPRAGSTVLAIIIQPVTGV